MLTRTAIAESLRLSLQDSAQHLDDDGAFLRCVDQALQHYQRLRPHRSHVQINWYFGAPSFEMPDHAVRVPVIEWSAQARNQWREAANLAPPAPLRAKLIDTPEGRRLLIEPPLHGCCPGGGQVNITLHCNHTLAADDTDPTPSTVPEQDGDLLLQRAQVQALQELANRNISKPISLRDGQSQGPRNGTPASLRGQLLQNWLEAMRD